MMSKTIHNSCTYDVIEIGSLTLVNLFMYTVSQKQENLAVADKPEHRESMPKIAPIRRENKLQTS